MDMSQLNENNYLIRLTSNKGYFIHRIGEADDKESIEYKAKTGSDNACLWTKEDGENFITDSGYPNLELIKASDIS